MWVQCLLVLSAYCVLHVHGFSRGPPVAVCSSMNPHHNEFEAQTSSAPYSLTLDKRKIAQGEKVRITLTGSESFKGFLLQARQSGNETGQGLFHQEDHKYMSCSGGYNNGVSHKDPESKNSVTVQWEGTSAVEGQVTFRCTFVKDFSTFWVGVESLPLTVEKQLSFPGNKPTSGTTQKTTSTTTPKVTANTGGKQSEALNEAIYSECGRSVGCFGYHSENSDTCVENGNCNLIATYMKSNNGNYRIQLQGETPGYVALGFSKDDKMNDAAVVECVLEGSEIKVYRSYNVEERKTNKRMEEHKGISNVKGSYTDGVLSCSFNVEPSLETPEGEFDLDEDMFHLLLAAGGASSDNIGFHSNGYTASSEEIDVSDVRIAAAKSDLLIKIHGGLMIAAWMGAASCGIILARYFKKSWSTQCCGKDRWFQWHRFFMVLTWSCSIAGFVVIFVELQDWTSETTNPHAYLGVISTALCFIQPFMALCRPGPNASSRPIFNWSHWAVGNAAHQCGLVAILFSTKLNKANLPDYFLWVAVAFVVFYVVSHLLLSIIDCTCNHSSKNISPEFNEGPGEVFKMHSKGPYMGRAGKFDAGGASPKSGWVQREPPRNKGAETCKKCYLFIYEVTVWAFAAVLIYVLVEKPTIDL